MSFLTCLCERMNRVGGRNRGEGFEERKGEREGGRERGREGGRERGREGGRMNEG